MTYPLLALTWELCARRRGLLRLAAAYTALLLLGAWLLDTRHGDLLGVGFIGFLLFPVPAFVGAVCLGGNGPLEGRASLFPRRLFRLPVPTWGLVAPPLLLGTVVSAIVWTALVSALSHRRGLDLSVMWPGLLVAASVAWVQALTWSPFPLVWLRIGSLALLVLAAIGGAVGLGYLPAGMPEAVLVATLGLAYLVAHHGVRLARHGVGMDDPLEPVVASTAREPFASPAAALLWREWRLVRVEVFFLAVSSLIWVVPVALMTPAALRNLAGSPPVDAAVDAVGIGWLAAAVPLLMPLCVVAVLGSGLGRLGDRRDRFVVSPFLATKPIDNATLLRVKWGLLARLVIGGAVLGAILALVCSVTNGRLGEMAERLTVPALIGGVVGAAALAWLWAAGSLWSGLWGKWWAPLPGLVAVGAFLVGVQAGLAWLAVLAIVVHVAGMTPLLRRTSVWPLLVVLAVGAIGVTLAGWWPVAVPLWAALGLPLAPTALAENRHR